MEERGSTFFHSSFSSSWRNQNFTPQDLDEFHDNPQHHPRNELNQQSRNNSDVLI